MQIFLAKLISLCIFWIKPALLTFREVTPSREWASNKSKRQGSTLRISKLGIPRYIVISIIGEVTQNFTLSWKSAEIVALSCDYCVVDSLLINIPVGLILLFKKFMDVWGIMKKVWLVWRVSTKCGLMSKKNVVAFVIIPEDYRCVGFVVWLCSWRLQGVAVLVQSSRSVRTALLSVERRRHSDCVWRWC